MDFEGWKMALLKAADDHLFGDSDGIDLLAEILWEQDRAKEMLKRCGFDSAGMPWPAVVEDMVARGRFES